MLLTFLRTSLKDLIADINLNCMVKLVKDAWSTVNVESIRSCFRKCGFVATRIIEDNPDYSIFDIEAVAQLEQLCTNLNDEFMYEEVAIETHDNYLEEDWEDNILNGDNDNVENPIEFRLLGDNDDDDDDELEEPIIKIIIIIGMIDLKKALRFSINKISILRAAFMLKLPFSGNLCD